MIIINYHNILPEEPNAFFARIRREWHTQDEFERHILALRERFEFVSLQEIVEALRDRKIIPKGCAITFDDGNLGAYKYGLPVLEKYNVPASFFIITQKVENGKCAEPAYFDWLEAILYLTSATQLDLTDFGLGISSMAEVDHKAAFFKAFRRQVKVIPAVEKRRIDIAIAQQLQVTYDRIREYLGHEAYRMMSWEQIEDFLARGGAVGGHTRTHPSLSQVDDAQLEFEICGSYQDLHERLGLKKMPFAYPFGNTQHISDAAIETTRQSGYCFAVTMCKGKNKPGIDLFQLRRMDFKRANKKFGLVDI